MHARPTARLMQADAAAFAAAAACLAAGGLVAFPTETVYGLGADATSATAVARLYAAKGRPRFNPLIAHVADTEAARRLAKLDDAAERLAAVFWPGPLSIVARRRPACPVCELATAGLETVALRVPRHAAARALIGAFGLPIVAPSANPSGRVSPTRAEHVIADLGTAIDLVIDGGPTTVGVESTVVACLGARPVLLRPGGLPRADIEQLLGERLADPPPPDAGDAPSAPGMLASHYAPRSPLRLEAQEVAPGEALLAFGPVLPAGAAAAAAMLNLSWRGDLVEAAANLFAHLRALDASGASVIAVTPVPNAGIGEAINDRLTRAAVPRTGSAAR